LIKTGEIPKFKQGKHRKRLSLLDDEDLKTSIAKWIKTLKPSERKIEDIEHHINEVILPQKIGLPGSISKRTIYRYLKLWGFTWKESGQQVIEYI